MSDVQSKRVQLAVIVQLLASTPHDLALLSVRDDLLKAIHGLTTGTGNDNHQSTVMAGGGVKRKLESSSGAAAAASTSSSTTSSSLPPYVCQQGEIVEVLVEIPGKNIACWLRASVQQGGQVVEEKKSTVPPTTYNKKQRHHHHRQPAPVAVTPPVTPQRELVVHIITPVHASMLLCPTVLSKKPAYCKFGDSCRFSHGVVVAPQCIRPATYSSTTSATSVNNKSMKNAKTTTSKTKTMQQVKRAWQVGTEVLALYEAEGLYYQAKITDKQTARCSHHQQQQQQQQAKSNGKQMGRSEACTCISTFSVAYLGYENEKAVLHEQHMWPIPEELILGPPPTPAPLAPCPPALSAHPVAAASVLSQNLHSSISSTLPIAFSPLSSSSSFQSSPLPSSSSLSASTPSIGIVASLDTVFSVTVPSSSSSLASPSLASPSLASSSLASSSVRTAYALTSNFRDTKEDKANQRGVAEWCKHTTGFGLKMLQQQGYSTGEGLGLNKQGIIAPVEAAKKRSKGGEHTALDFLHEPAVSKAIEVFNKKNSGDYSHKADDSVFSFLNSSKMQRSEEMSATDSMFTSPAATPILPSSSSPCSSSSYFSSSSPATAFVAVGGGATLNPYSTVFSANSLVLNRPKPAANATGGAAARGGADEAGDSQQQQQQQQRPPRKAADEEVRKKLLVTRDRMAVIGEDIKKLTASVQRNRQDSSLCSQFQAKRASAEKALAILKQTETQLCASLQTRLKNKQRSVF